MKLFRILLIAAGAILLIWFLLPFFTKRILNIGNVTGIIISVLMLFYGLFFPAVNSLIVRLWKIIAGKIILIIALAACTVIFILAVCCIVCMLTGLSASKRAGSGRTVIVLGCKVYDDKASLMLTERLEAALGYLKENPESSCIVSGGKGQDEPVTEASVMYEWLKKNGIDEDRIFIEDTSSDTHENIVLSAAIIKANNLSLNVAIATNDFHEYRALRVAEAAGLNAKAIPAGTAWWLFPTYFVREMYGILQDWFLIS